ncbi:hypothetical protein [Pigmentiphaga sp.]|uniref:hypothetical protein n=1 Tax=Pigmentiphaga sp. TaxID=1977564 RepID=UPI0025F99A18|nr:hypothetical protein [Pigmentiphaga sp.]
MALAGTAFLALFNGFDPARDDEYNVWHSVEHVPERLTMPGIVRARRYVNRQDAGLPYFTLYELASIDAMYSAAYLHLIMHPTAWTQRMRVSFGRFLRAPCRTLASQGDGMGAAMQATLLRGAHGEAPAGPAVRALADSLGRLDGIVGVHVGLIDDRAPPVPGLQAAAPSDSASALVVLIEAQEEHWLYRQHDAIGAALGGMGGSWGVPEHRVYRLMHVLDAGRSPEETARLRGG